MPFGIGFAALESVLLASGQTVTPLAERPMVRQNLTCRHEVYSARCVSLLIRDPDSMLLKAIGSARDESAPPVPIGTIKSDPAR
jgi:hypothetical protein